MYKKAEKIKIVMDEMKHNLNRLPMAVKKAGISLPVWYLWEKKNPRLNKLRKAAENICKDNRNTAVIDANFKSALGGNVAAQCFYLKNNAGWSDGALIDQSKNITIDRRTFVYLDEKAVEEAKTANATTNRIKAELSAE